MRTLGSRYLLEEQIGQGAMGVVWRGRDKTTGTQYAVKLLRAELSADQDAVTRFVRERTVLMKFRHPAVVSVHDMIVEGEHLALVMDLVEGGDLNGYQRRSGGTLSAAETARIGAQICDGLDAAHQAGIVHRDLKPANVLLDGGQVRLADFGVARFVGDPSATTTGIILGTAAYLAPELLTGSEPSAAGDIYALGITLYEMLAGRPPFSGHIAAIMHDHLQTVPSRIPGVPDPLWNLVSSCLAKTPEARPTAAAMAHALRDPALASVAAESRVVPPVAPLAAAPVTRPSFPPVAHPSLPPVPPTAVAPVPPSAVPLAAQSAVPPASLPPTSLPPMTRPSVPPVTRPSVPPVTRPSVPPVTRPSVPPVTRPSVPPVTQPSVPPVTQPSVPPVTQAPAARATASSFPPVTQASVPLAPAQDGARQLAADTSALSTPPPALTTPPAGYGLSGLATDPVEPATRLDLPDEQAGPLVSSALALQAPGGAPAPARSDVPVRSDAPAPPQAPVPPDGPARPDGPVRSDAPAQAPVRPQAPARPEAPVRVGTPAAADALARSAAPRSTPLPGPDAGAYARAVPSGGWVDSIPRRQVMIGALAVVALLLLVTGVAVTGHLGPFSSGHKVASGATSSASGRANLLPTASAAATVTGSSAGRGSDGKLHRGKGKSSGARRRTTTSPSAGSSRSQGSGTPRSPSGGTLAAYGPNLLQDGDFADGTLGPWDATDTLNATITPGVGPGGANAVRLIADPSAGIIEVVSGLKPGASYLVSGWGETNLSTIYIGAADNDEADSNEVGVSFATTSWRQGSVVFTLGAGQNSAQIFCVEGKGGSGYCANISFRAMHRT
jgi:serine/threonine protein kinase, bacterial